MGKMNKEQLEALFKRIDNNEPTWQRAVPKAPENRRPFDQRPLATEFRESPLPYGHFEELKADGRRLPAPPRPPAQVSAKQEPTGRSRPPAQVSAEQEPTGHFAQLKATGVNLPAAPQPKQDHGNVQTPGPFSPTKAPGPKYRLNPADVLQGSKMEQQLSANSNGRPQIGSRGYDASKSLDRTNR
jgi:hypothetical protein